MLAEPEDGTGMLVITKVAVVVPARTVTVAGTVARDVLLLERLTNDPTVGAYFDVTNMIRFGFPPQQWIRDLAKRMLKFDFKAYSHARFMNEQNPWVPIGEGDEPWPKVLKALADVGYEGWATSEVSAGGRDHLKDVAARMDKVLGLA